MATRWMWTRGLAGLLLGASASVALAQDNGFAPPVSKGTSPQASPDAPAGEVDRKGDSGWGGKSASAGPSATADKTAFFGWGCGLGFNCGLGCAPCRPACRPVYGPACPPVYAPQPCSYPAQPYGYPVGGGNCQPGYGGCPQPGGVLLGPGPAPRDQSADHRNSRSGRLLRAAGLLRWPALCSCRVWLPAAGLLRSLGLPGLRAVARAGRAV